VVNTNFSFGELYQAVPIIYHFVATNQPLNAKKVKLCKDGKAQCLNTSKAVPKEEEDLMWEHGTVKGLFTPIINVHCLVLFHQVFRSTGK
jgi:hypothetical protein